MTKTFGIYIPAYNSEKTLLSVLDRIPKDLVERAQSILLVNNCSQDATESVAIECRKAYPKLDVLSLPKNLGYGGSQKIGYRYFYDKVDYIVMLHSDGQYAPEVLPQLLQPVLQDQCDMIFGSRISGSALKGGMPLHRYLGNLFLTRVQNILLGSNLTEFHSGYRIYSSKFLKQIKFEALSDDYHFDTEMLILHLAAKARTKEIPIPTHYGDEENYVNIWAYGIHILITTGTYCLHRLGIRRSRNWGRILEQDISQVRKSFLEDLLSSATFNGKPKIGASIMLKEQSLDAHR